MPADVHETPTERLFVALDIPDRIRSGLEAWGVRELADPALRPVPAENLHLTLVFLGQTEFVKIAELSSEVVNLPCESVRIQLAPEITAKPSRRPALWAFEAEAPALVTLQARLCEELSLSGLHEPEERSFWPHLTVARTRTEHGKRRPRRVENPPGELPPDLTQPFDAVRVSLYRSDPRPDGAKYVSLAELDLPPSPKSLGEER